MQRLALTICIVFVFALSPTLPSSRTNAVAAEKKNVVFIAGTKSHGYGSHEHLAGCMLLAKSLEQGMPNIKTVVLQNGWPKDPNALAGADTVVMYADGGGRHPGFRLER